MGGLDSDTTTGIALPFLALAEPEDAKRKHPASVLMFCTISPDLPVLMCIVSNYIRLNYINRDHLLKQ